MGKNNSLMISLKYYSLIIQVINSEEISLICRKDIVKMTTKGKSSHVASCLSCVDILAVLYSSILNIDPKNPRKSDRDIFIMSKGHAGAALYSVLARVGFFDPSLLDTHYQNGGNLSGHVNSHLLDGVEVSTGSLGNGLGLACGYAYYGKVKDTKFKTYTLISDGELNEGSTWEAILFAAHHKLKNLTCILDANKYQSIKTTTETLNVEPIKDRILSFGWEVKEINGHNHKELKDTFQNKSKKKSNKPIFVIARTTKGKGVSFMENNVLWHYRNAQGDEFKDAMKELL